MCEALWIVDEVIEVVAPVFPVSPCIAEHIVQFFNAMGSDQLGVLVGGCIDAENVPVSSSSMHTELPICYSSLRFFHMHALGHRLHGVLAAFGGGLIVRQA